MVRDTAQLLAGIVIFCTLVSAQTSTPIARSGNTEAKGTCKGSATVVFVRAVTVTRGSEMFPLEEDGFDFFDLTAVSVLRQMKIKVGGNELPVPRSAFSGVFQANNMSIQSSKNECFVMITAGDGANSHMVQIYFDKNGVLRQSRFGFLWDRSTEDIKYNSFESPLGDPEPARAPSQPSSKTKGKKANSK